MGQTMTSPSTSTPTSHVATDDTSPAVSDNVSGSRDVLNDTDFMREVLDSNETHNTFSPRHLLLLSHLERAPEGSMFGQNQYTILMDFFIDMAFKYIIDGSYFMDQLLAISALHLAYQARQSSLPGEASNSESYRHLATELQTRALRNFATDISSAADRGAMYNCIPRFLFSSFLSLHRLTETLTYDRGDFHDLISRLAECFIVSKGVLVMIRPNWDYLKRSELKVMLSFDDYKKEKEFSPECDILDDMMKEADLSEKSTEACNEAINSLRMSFEMYHRDEFQSGTHPVSAFSITLPSDYVNLLRKYQPEALIILAHFGILLHRCRDFWMFEDAGSRLIRLISEHLGVFWAKWMEPALEALGTTDRTPGESVGG